MITFKAESILLILFRNLFNCNNILKFISKRAILIVFLLLITFSGYGQSISVGSWNLKDFGNSKNDQEMEFIANTIRDFDVIIQEVVAGNGGAQAVARLHDILNRKGLNWDYSISDPTFGSAYTTERYAYIWKTSRLEKIGDTWLDQKFNQEIDREPFFIRLSIDGNILH